MSSQKRPLVSDANVYMQYKRSRASQPKPTGLSTAVNKKIKKLIKKTLNNSVEKKKFIEYAANQALTIGSAGVYPFTASITCAPVAGADDGERIANRINVLNGYIRGFVNLRPYDVVVNTGPPPIWLRILIVSYKREKTTSIAQTNFLTDFFDVNNGGTGFQSTMLDMVLPVNPESWTVIADQVVKLGGTSATTTGGLSTTGFYDQSDMSHRFEFDLGRLGIHTWTESSTICTNKDRWLVIQPVNANGTAYAAEIPAEVHYMVEYKYTDM